jgi:hypothetical protein
MSRPRILVVDDDETHLNPGELRRKVAAVLAPGGGRAR